MLLGKFVPIFNSLFDIKNHVGKFSAEKTWEVFRAWNIQITWKMGKVVERNGIHVIQQMYIESKCKSERTFGTVWICSIDC